MHCRKLHTRESDKEKLYEALKVLYRDGVRIPFGKPYDQRKSAGELVEEESTANDDDPVGLELVRDEGPAPGADGDLYGRT